MRDVKLLKPRLAIASLSLFIDRSNIYKLFSLYYILLKGLLQFILNMRKTMMIILKHYPFVSRNFWLVYVLNIYAIRK